MLINSAIATQADDRQNKQPVLFHSERLITLETETVLMRNWLAGIIAFFGLAFFFFVERNLLGFIVLIICAVVAAILFSEPEMDERIKKIRESDKKKTKEPKKRFQSTRYISSHLDIAHG